MITTYRVRWPVVVVSVLPAPLLLVVLVGIVLRPVGVGIAVGAILATAVAVPAILRVRRRFLRVTEYGVEVQRDKFGLRASWDVVTGVSHRRLGGMLAVDELQLADAAIVARNSRGKANSVPSAIATHPAARRIQVSVYDKQWRSGPIGDQLRRQALI